MDIGSKTIGIAISDRERRIASPLEIIRRAKFSQDIIRILEIEKEHRLCAWIIGYPINMDGSEGPRCQSTRDIAAQIGKHSNLPLALWDERMSSMASDRVMLDADMSRQKRKKNIDKLAATFILQGALDYLGRTR